jgi:hypothetical protein
MNKCLWIFSLVECPLWSWIYRFLFQRAHCLRRCGQSSLDLHFWAIPVVPYPKNAPFPYTAVFLPWRDVVVRLAYIPVFDNLVQVLWLRYVAADPPYTMYINNSEIFTILLCISLALYTCARMTTHVAFVAGKKDTAPIAVQSATTDLFTLNTLHHRYRTNAMFRWYTILFIAPTTMFSTATSAFATAHWAVTAFAILLVVICWFAALLHLMEETGDGQQEREERGKRREMGHPGQYPGEKKIADLHQWWTSLRGTGRYQS